MGLAVGQRDSGVSGAGHEVESGVVSWKARKCMNHRGVAVVGKKYETDDTTWVFQRCPESPFRVPLIAIQTDIPICMMG